MPQSQLDLIVRAVLVACGLASLLLRSAHAATVTVSGAGYSSLDNGANKTPFDVTSVDNPNGSKSVTGSGFERASNEPLTSLAEASGEGFVFAAPGLLKARVTSGTVNMSFVPNVPFLIYGPRVQVNFGGSFSDSITLTDPTLPVGAEVTYRTTIHVDSQGNMPHQVGPLLNPTYYQGSFYFFYAVGSSVGVTYSFPNGLFQSVPNLGFDQSFDVMGHVGDVIPVVAQLGLGAESRAGFDPSSQTYWGNGEQTIIDASNSVQLFVDPVTSGLSIVSDSGHDYSTVVPEPATVSLLVIGLFAGTAAVRSLVHRGRMSHTHQKAT